MAQIWSFIAPSLLSAIKDEPDKDVVAILMESLAKVIPSFIIIIRIMRICSVMTALRSICNFSNMLFKALINGLR